MCFCACDWRFFCILLLSLRWLSICFSVWCRLSFLLFIFFLFLISQHLVLIKGPYGSPYLMHSSSTEDGKLRICAVTFIPERWKTVSDEHCDRQIQTARHRNTNRWSWNVDDTGINMNEKRLQNVILYVNCCCRRSLKSSFCASCLHPVKPCCWFELLASNKVTYKVSFSFETVCY